MKRILVSAALVAAFAAPVVAQNAPVTTGHGSFYVGPYAGYMVFGDLVESQDGNTKLSNENGGFFGAQAGYSFSPNVSLLGNLGYTKSKFTLENDATNTTSNISGDLGVFLYDASLQFRLPFANRMGDWIAPLAQVGAGAVKYTFDTDDLASRGTTNIAFNAGLGADFQLGRTVGLRVMAKDYITSLDWNKISSVEFRDRVKGNTAHNIALTAGLNFGF
ncbi:MAG: outer membrane beta-barrel protein [Gemmatimonadaceae bacterium]